VKRILSTTLALAFLASAVCAESPRRTASARPRLTLEPAELRIAPGERRLVYVQVAGIPQDGLAAFQIELHYDPAAVEMVDPNAGFGAPAFAPLGGSPLCPTIRRKVDCPDPAWMLTIDGRQAVGATDADPATGRLTIAYGSSGQTVPVGGSGTLAVVEVIGRVATRTRLKIGDAILADAADPPGRYPYSLGPSRKSVKPLREPR